MFQDMLCADVKRGPHSTGVITASKKRSGVMKDTVLPWDLIRTEEFEGAMKHNWPCMMGHNRMATIGDVSVDNAHPFWHGDVILTHNGTVDEKKLDQHQKFETDSECIAWNIADKGVEETYKMMDGGSVLVWWDAKKGRLNLISNGGRPFNFIWSKDQRSLYYASEDWMIKLAAAARGVELEKTGYTPNAHQYFQFYLNKKGEIVKEARRIDPFVKPIVRRSSVSGTHLTGPKKGKRTTGHGRTSAKHVRVVNDAGKVVEGARNFYGKASELINSEFAFNLQFQESECVLCKGELEGHYQRATLLDFESVVCGDCTELAEYNHIPII